MIAGKDKGAKGKVIAGLPASEQRVLVEGVNRVKKHTKVGQTGVAPKTGGIITSEAPIHVSNVMRGRGRRQDRSAPAVGYSASTTRPARRRAGLAQADGTRRHRA